MADQPSKQESYILKVTEIARQYAKELLEENLNLRTKAAVLTKENTQLSAQLATLQKELEVREVEEERLKRSVIEAEQESAQFSDRYLEVERQSANLANLYVASYRLHGSVDLEEVLTAIQEIVANLIGSEELAVFDVDHEQEKLSLMFSHGIDAEHYRSMGFGDGQIGRTARTGLTYIADADGAPGADEANLSACVPLKLDGEVNWLIALFRLLPQKEGFEEMDRELFDLLGNQSATALYCAVLHRQRTAMGDAWRATPSERSG